MCRSFVACFNGNGTSYESTPSAMTVDEESEIIR